MTAAAWIGLVSPSVVIAGGAVAAVVRFTRIAIAVEQLAAQMGKIIDRTDDHEHRLDAGGL